MTDSYTKEWGSEVAKSGFENEEDIKQKFNSWKEDKDSKNWLQIIHGDLGGIESVDCENLNHNVKPDICVEITSSKGKSAEYISIKKSKSSVNYNQVDKRWVERYGELWGISEQAKIGLKMFVGRKGWKPEEIQKEYNIPELDTLKDNRYAETPRRLYCDELPDGMRQSMINWLNNHKDTVLEQILSGSDDKSADWVMVTEHENDEVQSWNIVSMPKAIEQVSGEVTTSSRGNMKIGDITVQRKGGDNGRETAQMLQFKMNPLDLTFG